MGGKPAKTEASALYDAYAHAQRLAARDLLAFTGTLAPRTILEPGCGTGLYTRMLRDAFPAASILAVDLLQQRVDAARNTIVSPLIGFLAADAEELPFAPYDLITSNAAFQWFRKMPLTIRRFARMLTDGGVLSYSFFGPGTYRELDGAMRDVFGGSAAVAARGFAGRDALGSALAACFSRWDIEERTYTRTFPSLMELLRSIKFTETRGMPSGGRFLWSRGTLARLEESYTARWGCIRASYQVYLCKGER